jgi:hypothetical protein
MARDEKRMTRLIWLGRLCIASQSCAVPLYIGGEILADRVHRLSDAGVCRQMIHVRHILERVVHCGCIANIRDLQLDVGV